MALHVSEPQALKIPIVDIKPLVSEIGNKEAVAAEIAQACRSAGFFYIVGHGIDESLQQQLEQLSRQFFAQPLATKLRIRMALGGRAWRGYFSVGGELTSGKPDLKEGIYFGTELAPDHPSVQAQTPMHGANLFPATIPQLQETVLAYMAAMTQLGHTLMRGIALSLDLEEHYFRQYTSDPLTLFRVFNYPPHPINCSENWGVGEHTDYGVLTILKQDESGGLQIKTRFAQSAAPKEPQWIDAPPIAGSFVCNIGDMLDRMTGGYYRSTPHRVRNLSKRDRLSFPFFFDPNFDAEVKPIPITQTVQDDQAERWDRSSVHTFQGTYGDYVLSKVSKVFPELQRSVF